MKPEELDKVADFILEHWWPANAWPEALFNGWLKWHASKGYLMVIEDGESIQGLSIARPLKEIYEGIENDFRYDDNGKVIYLDLVIAETKRVLIAIALAIMLRFGRRNILAFKINGALKLHSYENVRKALSKTRK